MHIPTKSIASLKKSSRCDQYYSPIEVAAATVLVFNFYKPWHNDKIPYTESVLTPATLDMYAKESSELKNTINGMLESPF